MINGHNIKKAVELLATAANAKRIILFGSQDANGAL